MATDREQRMSAEVTFAALRDDIIKALQTLPRDPDPNVSDLLGVRGVSIYQIDYPNAMNSLILDVEGDWDFVSIAYVQDEPHFNIYSSKSSADVLRHYIQYSLQHKYISGGAKYVNQNKTSLLSEINGFMEQAKDYLDYQKVCIDQTIDDELQFPSEGSFYIDHS